MADLEKLAIDLLQTLNLSTWNEETQTDDVDSSQVTDVLAAFDAAREIGRPYSAESSELIALVRSVAPAPSQEPSPVDAGEAAAWSHHCMTATSGVLSKATKAMFLAGFAAGRASAKAEQAPAQAKPGGSG